MSLFMDPADRAAYDAMMREIIGPPGGRAQPTRLTAVRVLARMQALAAEGREWAQGMIEDDTMNGVMVRVKAWAKHQDIVLIDYHGKVIGKTKRTGVKKVRRRKVDAASDTEASPPSGTYWQQSLFDDMTWQELREALEATIGRIAGEQINRATTQKLLSLEELAPGSETPREACEMLGTTVDAYLLHGLPDPGTAINGE